jgi:hypothetical protein
MARIAPLGRDRAARAPRRGEGEGEGEGGHLLRPHMDGSRTSASNNQGDGGRLRSGSRVVELNETLASRISDGAPGLGGTRTCGNGTVGWG